MKKYLIALSVVGASVFCQNSNASNSFKLVDSGVTQITFETTPVEAGGSTNQILKIKKITLKPKNYYVVAFIEITENMQTTITQLPYSDFYNSSSGLFITYKCVYNRITKEVGISRTSYNLNLKNLGSLNTPSENIKLQWYLIQR